jgi:hypothetical protein
LAKFQRLGPIWRKPKPKPWKQKKAATIWANERQSLEDDPTFSLPVEIEAEQGGLYFVLEQDTTTFISVES